MTDLPYTNSSFDVFSCINSMSHAADIVMDKGPKSPGCQLYDQHLCEIQCKFHFNRSPSIVVKSKMDPVFYLFVCPRTQNRIEINNRQKKKKVVHSLALVASHTGQLIKGPTKIPVIVDTDTWGTFQTRTFFSLELFSYYAWSRTWFEWSRSTRDSLSRDRTSLLWITKTAEPVADESSVPIDLASVLVTRPASLNAYS